MFANRSREKKHKRYLFYRFYCVTSIILFYVIAYNAKDYLYVGYPLLISAIFMILTQIAAFKFPYSIFGNLERTSPPNEQEIYSVRVMWGVIGLFYHAHGPVFSFKLYPSGLAISAWFLGKAFLPFQFVEKAKKNILMGYRVIHHSPEIRSPIQFPDKKLFEAFQNEFKKFKTGHMA